MKTKKVAIVGVAQTECKEKIPEYTAKELLYLTVKKLLNQLNITRQEIDFVISSSSDYWDGRGCSNVYTYDGEGAVLKEESKVEEDSAQAVAYAYARLQAEYYNTALVVSHTKVSITPSIESLTHVMSDVVYSRMFGIDELAVAAMQAALYMHKYGVTEEQISKVSVKNLGNALNNPYAHRKMKLKVEDVLQSPILAPPLRKLHCRPSSDGACAIMLASEEVAKKFTDTPVWIKGLGFCNGRHYLGEKDLIDVEALKIAAQTAYKMAGIENPLKQVDVAEICEPYASQELLWYEGLGFCGKGEGKKLIDEGITEMSGELPVNPSGGVLSTNPQIARGLIRVAEAALQVMGNAEKRQVSNVNTALAHSTHGLGGQLHTVIILGR